MKDILFLIMNVQFTTMKSLTTHQIRSLPTSAIQEMFLRLDKQASAANISDLNGYKSPVFFF